MSERCWEYLAVNMRDTSNNDADVEKRLSRLGSEGWELVAVRPFINSVTFYLKRQRKF